MQTEKANAAEDTNASITKEPLAKHPTEVQGMYPTETKVSIINTVLTGFINRYFMSADGKTITYIVAYVGTDGVNHEGSFTHQQLKVIE